MDKNANRHQAVPDSEQPAYAAMGAQAARGFAWMLGQTFGSKIFSFFTQIVLARILSRSDFGLVALAYTAVAFAGVIRQTGIQQILVQRHANFRRWVNPAFWFEFSVGIATALLLAVASPVAAVVFHSNALTGLILVIAAAAPLSPWFVVPTARLTIDMRFKAIAAVNITYNFIAMAMSIFLAWRGFGAYSFVIPLPIAGVIRAFWLWRLAKPHINPNPQFRRWKFLLGDSGLLLATGFFNSVMYQFGSLVLGLTYPKAVVGQFFLAFNLSTQMSQLLSQNVLTVLLPAFSWMQNQTRRHAAAFLYASRMLAFISIPLCLVMAVIAKPLILLLYGAKWSPAVPVLQALALAAVAYVPSSPAITAMQSQGRFRELFRWTMLQTVAYTVAICIGASAAGATGVALAILAYSIATSPVMIRIALHEGYHWREIIRVYFGPVATGTIAFAPLSGAFILWPELLHRYTLWLGLGIVTPALAFPFAARIFCPSEFRGVWGQVATLAYRGRLGSLSRRPPQK